MRQKSIHIIIICGLLLSLIQAIFPAQRVEAQSSCSTFNFGTSTGLMPSGSFLVLGSGPTLSGIQSVIVDGHPSVSVNISGYETIYNISYRVINARNMVSSQKWQFTTANPSFSKFFSNLTGAITTNFGNMGGGTMSVRIDSLPNDGQLHLDQSFTLEYIGICGIKSSLTAQQSDACSTYDLTASSLPSDVTLYNGSKVSGGIISEMGGDLKPRTNIEITGWNVVYNLKINIVSTENIGVGDRFEYYGMLPSYSQYFTNTAPLLDFSQNNNFYGLYGHFSFFIYGPGSPQGNQSFTISSLKVCGQRLTTPMPPTPTRNNTPIIPHTATPTPVPFVSVCDSYSTTNTPDELSETYQKTLTRADCSINPLASYRIMWWITIKINGTESGDWYSINMTVDGETRTYTGSDGVGIVQLEKPYGPTPDGDTINFNFEFFGTNGITYTILSELEVIPDILGTPIPSSTPTVTPDCDVSCFATPQPTLPWMATLLPTIQGTRLPRPINLPTRIPQLSPPSLTLPDLSIPTPRNINTPSAIGTPNLSLPTPSGFASTPQRITVTPPSLPTPGFSYEFSATVTVVAMSTLASKQFTLSIVMSTTVYTLDMSATATASTVVSSSYVVVEGFGVATGYISQAISLTNRLSSTTLGSPTATITMRTAPNDYVPQVPRQMANVGYTFEQMANGDNSQYGPLAYAQFAGQITTIPFHLLLLMRDILGLLGPLGLFIAWVIVMTPFVSIVKTIVFIKSLIIGSFNMFLRMIAFMAQIFQMLFMLIDLATNPVFLIFLLIATVVGVLFSCAGLGFVAV